MSQRIRHIVSSWFARSLTPVHTAFFGSILLSLIALQKGVINRDGMLYVDTAHVFIDQGFNAALEVFQWPFMSILMAILSQVTGLGVETTGHLLNVLFMAGACGLLVASAGRLFPEAIWPICLVVLSVPALNEYRDELLREYGAWFFLMLAVWLSLRWSEQPNWREALAIQAAIIVAALFRPEAMAYLAAIALWRLFATPGREDCWRQFSMLVWLAVCGAVIVVALYSYGAIPADRLMGELRRFELEGFHLKSSALASALIVHAKDMAPTILVIGSLGLVPLKYLMKLGLFAVPLVYAFIRRRPDSLISRSGVFVWLFALHCVMLAIFVLDMQFLAGRYVAPLIMFSIPVIGYGLARMMMRFPGWKWIMVTLALLVMASNVISSGAGKYHYVEAGKWLANNVSDSARVYAESGRAAYYAGWRYTTNRSPMDRLQLRDAMREGRYDLAVLEVPRKEKDFGSWLEEAGMIEIQRFNNDSGDSVRVAVPKRVDEPQ
jgi:hypothetical protein